SGWRLGKSSVVRRRRQRVEEPRTGELPFAFDSCARQIEYFGRLFERQPAEEAELGNAAFARVEGGQADKRGVKVEDVDIDRRRDCKRRVERHARPPARSFGRAVRTR